MTVALQGSGSDPDGTPITAYSWSRAGGTGPAVTLANGATPTPSFRTSVAGTYVFALSVQDSTGGVSANSARVTITVAPDGLPLANAGPDQTVTLGLGGAVQVTLAGSGSDPDNDPIAGYFWRRVGGSGSNVPLSDDRAASPNFFAVVAGTYQFSLTVTDSRGGVSTNLSVVTVNVVAGQRPVASAGSDQSVVVNQGSATLVTLSGGGVDPDGRPIVRYSWTRTGGTGPDVTLSDSTARAPTFTAVLPGTYSFGLTVFNDIGGTSANAAIVTVTALLNHVPLAAVGPNQTLFLPAGSFLDVALSGSATDFDGDAIVGYSWTRAGGTGPAVTLSDAAAITPVFRVTAAGTYVFSLAVTDARGGRSSNVAQTSIAVDQNRRPAANAGPNQSLVLQEDSTLLVTLAGSGSDPDTTGPLTYSWARAGGTGADVTLSSPTAASPSFTAVSAGTYVFGLTVTSSHSVASTNAASVTVSVALNLRPVATAGLRQRVQIVSGDSIRIGLSGAAVDPDGDAIVSYLWTRTGGNGPRIQLDNAFSSSPAFTATSAGIYIFSLAARDARSGISTNLATQQVEILINNRPAASAGASRRATVQDGQNTDVVLDGGATDPDGDIVPVYLWRRVGGTGPAVTLLETAGPNPRFTASLPGTYIFGLKVTDARGAASALESLATITVDVNRRPALSVGGDFQVIAGTNVTLDAAAFDPDGDKVLYSWQEVSGPAVTVPTTSAPQIDLTPASPGTYLIECKASDGRGGTDTQQLAVTAVAKPEAQLAAISVTPTVLTVRAGQLVGVRGDVTNVGRATSGASTIRFVLSSSATLDKNAPFLGYNSVGPMVPGEVRTLLGTFPLPSTLAPGNYFVGLVTDGPTFDAGLSPSGTTVTSPGTFTVQAVNLVTSGVTAPAAVRTGDVFTASATVSNEGNVDDNTAFRVDFLLSTNGTAGAGAVNLGGVLVPRLAAPALVTVSRELTVPQGLAAGAYFVVANADPGGLVGEPKRSDNVAASATAIAVTTPATVAFTIPLARGTRLVSLAYQPVANLTAADLLVARPGVADPGVVSRATAFGFESFFRAMGVPPFALEGGRGYQLARRGPAMTLSLVGRDWPSTVLRMRLERGTNIIGVPAIVRAGLTANDLATLTGSTVVSRIGPSGRFEVYLPGGQAPDFTLDRGSAYLVSVPAARSVTLPAAP
ncbi:MAG: PKD domain-containing protein [Candidatus Wallbacteria bacterium]|nr:PKD domain-containing protein [Candidatus Wallbacteria bacterium]